MYSCLNYSFLKLSQINYGLVWGISSLLFPRMSEPKMQHKYQWKRIVFQSYFDLTLIEVINNF